MKKKKNNCPVCKKELPPKKTIACSYYCLRYLNQSYTGETLEEYQLRTGRYPVEN